MPIARKRKQREIIVISSDEDEPESTNASTRQRFNPGRTSSSWTSTTPTEPLEDTMVAREQTLTELLSNWTTEELYARTQMPVVMCTLSSRQVAQRLLDERLQDPEERSSLESKYPCLAICSKCVPKQHLQRFNSKLYSCERCQALYPIWRHSCRCQHRLGEPEVPKEPEAYSNELRAAVEASGLSKLAQRVLLLISQVPVGHYTTYIALKEWYCEHYNMAPKSHIASALRKNAFAPHVPDHRVVASNGGLGRVLDWGDHGEDWEVRMEMLAEEGARFDRNGRLLGASFTSFR